MTQPKGRMLSKGFTTASAGAGLTVVVARPAIGQVWKCYLATAYHLVGAASVCNWAWNDVIGTLTFVPDISLATNTALHLGVHQSGGPNSLLAPFWISYVSYPSFLFTASGAAQSGYIRLLVEEFMGIVEE